MPEELTQMRQRRGLAADWATDNPILGPGEIGLAKDIPGFKFGDGTSHWNDLPLFAAASILPPQDERVDLFRSDVLAVSTGIARVYFEADGNITLARVAVGIPSVGADIIVTFLINDVAAFTMTIPETTNTVLNTALSVAVSAGSYVTMDITQVGTTTPGSHLTARLVVSS